MAAFSTLLLSMSAFVGAQMPYLPFDGPPVTTFPPQPPPGCPDGYPPAIVVDVSKTFQQMDGCGYSEAFQRSGWAYNALSPDNRGRVLDLLHNTTTGAGMSMYRIGIGSSPNSTVDHMNSIEPESPGSPDAPPVYHWDRNDSSQVWWAQEAKKRGCVYFYGDSWSADGYMKTNGVEYDGQYLCGVRGTNCPTGDWRQHYANKLVQWVKYYAEEGIDITQLGFVNEPNQTVTYASMVSDGYQAYDFFQILTPTVRAALPNVKLTWCDSAGWQQTILRLKDLTNAAGADTWETWFDLATSHGYDQPPTVPLLTNHTTWQTEWAALNSNFTQPWSGTGDEGEGIYWANAIANSFVVSNISLFTHWIGATTGDSASQLIRVYTNDSYEVSTRLWAFAAYCRYTRPGSVRVYANATQSYLNQYLTVSAFKTETNYADGGNLAVQIINNGPREVTVPVTLQGVREVQGLKTYLLDNNHMLTEEANWCSLQQGGTILATIPSLSMIVMSLTHQ